MTETPARTGCHAIRLYGKRWLKLAKPHTGPSEPIGWRSMVWCPDKTDAEKWSTHEAAEHFASGLKGRFEIVDLASQGAVPQTSA